MEGVMVLRAGRASHKHPPLPATGSQLTPRGEKKTPGSFENRDTETM